MNIIDQDPYDAALGSLNEARGKGDSGDSLVGFFGLTGDCLGNSIHTVERVSQWIGEDGPLQKGALTLPPRDLKRVRYYEKLLLLALFTSIGQKDDWREVRRDWDPELIAKIHLTYQSIIESQTGCKVIGRVPENGYEDVGNMETVLTNLADAQCEDHYILVFSKPDQTIFEAHAAYLHPKTGILVDTEGKLMWRISQEAHELFPKVVAKNYRGKQEGNFQFHLYKTRFASKALPLSFSQKISTAFSIFYNMGRHNKSVAARFGLIGVSPDCLVPCILPKSRKPEIEFYATLGKHLENRNYTAFLNCIKAREHRIWKAGNSRLPYCELTGNIADFIPLLEELAKMGPSVKPISLWLQDNMLERLLPPSEKAVSAKEMVQLGKTLRGILQFREPFQDIQEIICLMSSISHDRRFLPLVKEILKAIDFNEYHGQPLGKCKEIFYLLCKEGLIDLVELAVDRGFNPDDEHYQSWRVPCTFWEEGQSYREGYENLKKPIDAARASGKEDVVKYLTSLQHSDELSVLLEIV